MPIKPKSIYKERQEVEYQQKEAIQIKKLVLIFVLVVAIFSIGCSKQQLSPEGTMKKILDNVVKGDIDKALSYFVDAEGNPLSQEFKQSMKDSIQRNPIVSYKILGAKDFDTSSPEFSNLNIPLLKNAKIVSFSITEKATQRAQESQLIMVQHQGAWKVLIAVQPPTQAP